MKRLPELTIILAVMFSLAACGGGGAQQSDQGDSSDGQREAPATESAATDEASPDTATTEETAAEDEAAQGERGGESAGTSVTTLDGEQVSIGGGGDATALFFMAGW